MKRRILSDIKSLRCSGNVSGKKVLHVKKESRRIYKEYRTSAKLTSIKLIGVAGLCSGAGTTQMCIMLAVFMGKVLKKKTAVAGDEVTYSLMLRQMQKAAAIKHKGIASRHAYSMDGIDYYCGIRDEDIGILRQKYDVIILDISFENTFDNTNVTLARMVSRLSACDEKILAGSMLPWKSRECEKKMERIERFLDIRGLKMVTLAACDKEAVSIIKKHGVEVVLIPFERNPFVISGENLRSFLELLKIT